MQCSFFLWEHIRHGWHLNWSNVAIYWQQPEVINSNESPSAWTALRYQGQQTCMLMDVRKKKRGTMWAVKSTPHMYYVKGAILVPTLWNFSYKENMLFLCGSQLAMRYSVLKDSTLTRWILYLYFRQVLFGEGGSADGWRRCCWHLGVLLVVSPICPLPLRSIHSSPALGGSANGWRCCWGALVSLSYCPLPLLGSLKILHIQPFVAAIRRRSRIHRRSRILDSLFCWWLWRSCWMLSCVSQWSYFLFACCMASRYDMQGTV
jgi:hypothetical protein